MSSTRTLAVAVSVVGALGAVGHARAATIIVPDDRPTIRDAVAGAAAGDTIQVRPGTYAESVLVAGEAKARITLEGLGGRPLVTPPAGSDGFRVERAPRVTIRSFGVGGGAIGVHVLDSARAVVSDVSIAGSGEGVRVRRCRIGCEVRGVTIEGTTRGPGIRVRDSRETTVSRNIVLGSRREGIRITRVEELSVEANRVERSGNDGIRITRCERVQELEGNIARANRGNGLHLDRGYVAGPCSECNVEDNTAENNGRDGVRARRWTGLSSAADLGELENSASGNRGTDFRVRP